MKRIEELEQRVRELEDALQTPYVVYHRSRRSTLPSLLVIQDTQQ